VKATGIQFISYQERTWCLHELATLVFQNKRLLYDLLFRASLSLIQRQSLQRATGFGFVEKYSQYFSGMNLLPSSVA
jgi:hypothetical protein